MIPDPSLSLREGAIAVNGFKSMEEESWNAPLIEAVGREYGFTLDMPLREYSKEANRGAAARDRRKAVSRRAIFRRRGTGNLFLVERHSEHHRIPASRSLATNITMNSWILPHVPHVMEKGCLLKALSVTVGGLNIYELCSLNVTRELAFFEALTLDATEEQIAREILKEIRARLGFLKSVGLDYLTLWRKAGTLSGGEAQRIRLATQIGSSLVGVMYILDEPSIGLHQRDNSQADRYAQAAARYGQYCHRRRA